jgi:hypothetical protein
MFAPHIIILVVIVVVIILFIFWSSSPYLEMHAYNVVSKEQNANTYFVPPVPRRKRTGDCAFQSALMAT